MEKDQRHPRPVKFTDREFLELLQIEDPSNKGSVVPVVSVDSAHPEKSIISMQRFSINITNAKRTRTGFEVQYLVQGPNCWEIYEQNQEKFWSYINSSVKELFGGRFSVNLISARKASAEFTFEFTPDDEFSSDFDEEFIKDLKELAKRILQFIIGEVSSFFMKNRRGIIAFIKRAFKAWFSW
jgi:hypothetical protein